MNYNILCLVLRNSARQKHNNGVWLSLARAPGLGPGGRRFESCHPDFLSPKRKKRTDMCGCSSMVEH